MGRRTLKLSILLVFLALGCDRADDGTGVPDSTPPGPVGPTEHSGDDMRRGPHVEPQATTQPSATPDAGQPAAAGEGTGHIVLTAEGSRFDPAVAEGMIPAGAWYCDMGTVHYARAERGDGTCPVCGMDLVQKGGAGTGAGTGMH